MIKMIMMSRVQSLLNY